MAHFAFFSAPDMTTTSPASTSSASRQDILLAFGLLVFTAIVFWPPLRWLATQTFAREQLKQSFILVVLAGIWIAFENRRVLRLQLQFSNRTLGWFVASYALAIGALVFKTPLLILAGIVAAASGAVEYAFGRQALKRTLPLLAAFSVLIVGVLLFPILDWPLRKMAGIESARFLQSLGLSSQLAVSSPPDVKLFLIAPTQTFLVATECNGFGLITSSFLLGLIRLLHRRAAWGWFAVLLPLCVAVAFVFNFLRIAAIVMLAPRFPNHYDVLHEIAGLVALYSGLGVVWVITSTRSR
jgi:Transmembrane exosortase (Exosortase_EpsH).